MKGMIDFKHQFRVDYICIAMFCVRFLKGVWLDCLLTVHFQGTHVCNFYATLWRWPLFRILGYSQNLRQLEPVFETLL